MTECYVAGRTAEESLEKLATQYRDSCNFQDFIKVYIEELDEVNKALCQVRDLDIDGLGRLLNFPRCWCNIKRKKWFGFEKTATKFFGFDYEVGETPVIDPACIGGFGEGYWKEEGSLDDCALEALNSCCSINDPTIVGFCEGDFRCDKYPQHEDHCFDDDVEYAMLLHAKLLADKSEGLIDDILKVAIIMYGEATSIFYDEYGSIVLSLNRAITDHEIFLVDFYKNLLPAPNGVSVHIVDGLYKQFGFVEGSACLTDRFGGFCDGVFMRRY